MQCEVRFKCPQTNMKHAGEDVVENLGAMLKVKLYDVEAVHVR